MNVLLVEPQDTAGTRLSASLDRLGHRARRVQDASSVRRVIEGERFPLAIIGAGLPGASSICSEIRTLQNGHATVVACRIESGTPPHEAGSLAGGADVLFLASEDPARLDMQLRGLLLQAESNSTSAHGSGAHLPVSDRISRLEEAITELAAEIVERRDAEAALRNQKRLLQIMVENVPASVAMFDRNMCYLAVSKRWMTDYHLGERHILGLCHYDVFPKVATAFRERHLRCLAGAIEKGDEERFVLEDGAEIWERWEVRPWHEADGGVGGIIIFTENINARKKAEQELKESAMLYRALFDNVPVGLGLADMNGNLIAFNDFMLAPGGYAREDVQTIRKVEQLYYDPADRDAALALARKQGYLDRFEVRFKRKDGGYYWALMSLKAIAIKGQRCWQAMCEDISERKRAEAYVHALSQRVLTVQEDERRRVARELHDGVNQLLSAAKFHLLRMGGGGKKGAQGRSEPREVQDLLEQAIQEVRRIAQNLRPAVLDDLGLLAAVRSTCDEMSRRTGIEVAFECARLPKKLSHDLEMAIFRIVQEALANAEKHSGARHVLVKIGRTGQRFDLSVKDDGRGFEPRSVKVVRKGSEPGLGLEHMAERARLAGGTLEIRSARSSGTEVLARLPNTAKGARKAAAT
ncbi:MAG: PAS domain S-box protein [Planctomycetes bacterium]|nr:PAS domain S-box protein [Planctomycetota bacterium]